jgi:hypothetical protein
MKKNAFYLFTISHLLDCLILLFLISVVNNFVCFNFSSSIWMKGKSVAEKK